MYGENCRLVGVFSGTAQSVGCQVDGKPPHDVIDGVNSGEYDVPDVSIC